MSDFLLEIGTEEIPHWMIPSALAHLAKLDLFGATPTVDATPRRLVVRATGLPDRTPDQEQIIKGPPILHPRTKLPADSPKKQGVELSAMQKVGDYYELRKHVPGRRAVDILSETLPAAIPGSTVAQDDVLGRRQSGSSIHPPDPLDRRRLIQ